jgi:F0F1-type ATP synthase membrane subunit b/b'
MDALLMVGAWAAALMAVVSLLIMAWKAFVKVVETVIRDSMHRVWRDMDDIEQRLSALELSVQFIREQLEELRRMMQAHVERSDQ